MQPMQEKFQTTLLGKNEADEPWVSFESARRPRPQTQLMMPPSGIVEPTLKQMHINLAGSTDVTDCVNIPDVNRGFVRHNMGMTDDLYTGEHSDLFYGDAGGFVERNNYLDRY